MNIHPLLVHFPIALLTIYAVLELARFKQLKTPTVFGIKAFLSIVGFGTACVTWLSGEIAEKGVDTMKLARPEFVEVHSKLSMLSVVVFGVLAAAYVVVVLKQWNWSPLRWLVNLFGGLATWVTESWMAPLLALGGLGLILLTGALGGIIVYGPDLDPVTRLVYELFKGAAELHD